MRKTIMPIPDTDHNWKQRVRACWPFVPLAGMGLLTMIALSSHSTRADGGIWTLPYTGAYNSAGTLVSLTNTGTGTALTGETDNGTAVVGVSMAGSGVYGKTANGYGIFGNSEYIGVYGNSVKFGGSFSQSGILSFIGVYGNSVGVDSQNKGVGYGVYGNGSYVGLLGNCNASFDSRDGLTRNAGFQDGYGIVGQGNIYGIGVLGDTLTPKKPGVYGFNTTTDSGWGVYGSGAVGVGGVGNNTNGIGVSGSGSIGIYGNDYNPNSVNTSYGGNYAGYFSGNVQVNGTLTAATKNFKIDHPLDPANKYLVHACVESSEMINIYRGNVTLDSDGNATVQMPDWFQAENGDFSYQLTAIGDAAPELHIGQKMEHNQFAIAGGKAGMEVSWQVTGVRQDAYAKAHPMRVEEDKTGREKGKYLNPTVLGKSRTLGIDYEMSQRATQQLSSPAKMKEPILPKMPTLPSVPSKPIREPAPLGNSSSANKP